MNDGLRLPDLDQSLLYILAALKLENRAEGGVDFLTKSDSQVIIDAAWNLLESPVETPTRKEADGIVRPSNPMLRRLANKIALTHDVLPSSFLLKGVERTESGRRWAGGFAEIFFGRTGDQLVAIKRLNAFHAIPENERVQARQALYRECLLWKGLNHTHILRFLGIAENVFEGSDSVCIVSPWMENGRIVDYIKTLLRTGRMDSSELPEACNKWLYEIALGLEYLHDENVVHGDLHGGNILVDADGHIRLTDFGLSVWSDAMPYANGSVHGGGALRWTAPELIDADNFGFLNRRPTFQSDIYAFACVVCEIYAREHPFAHIEPAYLVTNLVMRGERPARPVLPEGDLMSDDLWSLVSRSWVHEPWRRPSIKMLVRTISLIVADTATGDDTLEPVILTEPVSSEMEVIGILYPPSESPRLSTSRWSFGDNDTLKYDFPPQSVVPPPASDLDRSRISSSETSEWKQEALKILEHVDPCNNGYAWTDTGEEFRCEEGSHYRSYDWARALIDDTVLIDKFSFL